MSLDSARQLADAVLLDGELLASSRTAVDGVRRAFGILAPKDWCEAGGGEAWWMQAECLVEPGPGGPPFLGGCVRFFHAQSRTVERSNGAGGESVPEEGTLRECPLHAELSGVDCALPLYSMSAESLELLHDPSGAVREGVVHRRRAITGRVVIRCAPIATTRPLLRVTIRVENLTPMPGPGAALREEALSTSLLSAHLALTVTGGAFISLLEPPAWARPAADGCRNIRAWPVLAGPPGARDAVLVAPIILHDHSPFVFDAAVPRAHVATEAAR